MAHRAECRKSQASPPHITAMAELVYGGFLGQNCILRLCRAVHLGQRQLGMLVLQAQGPVRTSCLLVHCVRRMVSLSTSPMLARGSKSYLTPAPTTARAPNLQTGGPDSAAGAAHPPSSWVCRDNQAGRGGDETWGSEALRTVKEEG